MRHSFLVGMFVTAALLVGASDANARSKAKARRSVPRPTIYTVKAGEPLYRVAEKFRCSIGELRDANQLPKGRIRGGLELRIPSTCSKRPIEIAKQNPEASKAVEGQSVGAPWDGRLAAPNRLKAGKGYVIRRSGRVYGTATTIELVRDALVGFREEFPKSHIVAVGDISAKSGGRITQHSSHQSGRDIDLGLIYKKKPAAFPTWFIKGTADNLDIGATWGLIRQFTRTRGKDGGVQVIFLDYKVQGIIYNWAKDHGVDQDQLDKTFQYPRGRSSPEGMLRHEPHHDDHIHVRFTCNAADRDCH